MRARTRDARHLSPEAQEVLREKAVAAVKQQGRSKAEVCRLFGISRQALYTWLKRQARGGRHPLKARPRGRPRGGQLKGWQAAQVVRTLTHCCPEQMHLPFYLWTREAVGELIARRYGLRLSVWTVGRYLRAWGFTPQKPLRRAYERDPKAVRRWLEVEYPRIRAAAKRAGAQIYWGDEMGLRSDHQAGTSWGKRGQTPVIRGPGRRFRCNMISAITNRGRLYFMVFRHRFTARVFLRFCHRLLRHVRHPVFLIVDGHPVHTAAVTQRWLHRHRDRLRLFFLPPYSPELNPDEYLNQDVKTNALGRRPPQDADELAVNVRRYLRSTQRMPAVVQSFFHHPAVRYAAE
ncbi:IS630 family transposase [Nitrospira sp. Kam-Ns4a]